MEREKLIRVLIVDDSVTARNLLKLLLSMDPRIEIAGMVSNGKEAVSFVEKEKPDVISMDIHMPVMNGFEATRQIMATNPVPIVIVSSAYNSSETQLSFKALEAGALTILPRPVGPGHVDFERDGKRYLFTIKSLSEVRVVRRRQGQPPSTFEQPKPSSYVATSQEKQAENITGGIVAIGASAGGPSALQLIMEGVPSDFPFPILIVQHIDKGFAEGFAQWLGQLSSVPVIIPQDGDRLLPGRAYLAPGDHHLGVREKGIVTLSKEVPDHGLRPSVSYLFRSVGDCYGKRAMALLLSGMGQDGAKELKTLKEMGAFTIVQDKESCLVYGMPGEAIHLEASCHVLPPEKMIQAIIDHSHHFQHNNH